MKKGMLCTIKTKGRGNTAGGARQEMCFAIARRGKFILLLAVLAMPAPRLLAQQLSRLDRELAETMLKNVSADVHKYYFDAKLHGLDWDALVRQTKESIDEAPNMQVANTEIAALLERLDDSHTRFYPPRNLATADYGFDFEIVGKRAYVTKVEPKSDAEGKGIHPGDELLTIDGFAVDRASAPKLEYALNVLIPRSSLQLDLRDPAGKLMHLDVAAKVERHAKVAGLGDSTWNRNQIRIDREKSFDKVRAKYKELGPDLMILRIPEFAQTGADVDALFKRARTHKTLIVDLRGSPGGRVDSVVSYLEDVFSRDVKVGNWVERGKVDPLLVKPNRSGAFGGDLIVLIDSRTASGGEIFARVVQLQERGTILGDHSSGRTMVSRIYSHAYGENPIYYYGASVTIGDSVMADGKSLEHIGVEPDRTMLPAASDIAAGRDPVLAYAAGLAGAKLSPDDAAKLFADKSTND